MELLHSIEYVGEYRRNSDDSSHGVRARVGEKTSCLQIREYGAGFWEVEVGGVDWEGEGV